SERLGDVVVGPLLEAAHRVVDAVARRQYDHRETLAPGAHLAEHFAAVEPGQTEVEDHQVEGVVAGERNGVRAGADGNGGVAVGAQTLLEVRDDALLVLGDQDPCHGGDPSPSATSSTARSASTGIVIVNLAPPPSTLATSTTPLWARAITSTIDSPMPIPSARRVRLAAPRTWRWNRWSAISGSTPGPVSRTHSRTVGETPLPETASKPSPISSPSSVCST